MTDTSRKSVEKIVVEPDLNFYDCHFCESNFSSEVDLELHSKLHTPSGAFACLVCKEVFSYLGHLKRHDLKHSIAECRGTDMSVEEPDDAATYFCAICSEVYSTNEDLDIHCMMEHQFENGHSEEGACSYSNYVCQSCKLPFAKKSSMLLHYQRVHQGMKPYKCNVCNKTFAKNSSFSTHFLKHKENRQILPCNYCPKRFLNPEFHKQHMILMHDGCKKKLSCNAYYKTFTDRNLLLGHMKDHKLQKNMVCVKCKKGFHSKQKLAKHICQRALHRLCECTLCGKRLTTKAQLNRHIKSHNGQTLKKPTKECEESSISEKDITVAEMGEVSCANLTDAAIIETLIKNEKNVASANPNSEASSKTNIETSKITNSVASANSYSKTSANLNSETSANGEIMENDTSLSVEEGNTEGSDEEQPHEEQSKNKSRGKGLRPKVSRVRHRCYICQNKWSTKSTLKDHFAHFHPGIPLNSCHICGKQFPTISIVSRHLQTHASARNIQCVKCDMCFACPKKMEHHIQRFHDNAYLYKCDRCNEAFRGPSEYNKHLNFLSKSEKPIFVCADCDIKFCSKIKFKKHIFGYHDPSRKFKCEHCGKAFCTRFDRDRHLPTHTGKKNNKSFECNEQLDPTNNLQVLVSAAIAQKTGATLEATEAKADAYKNNSTISETIVTVKQKKLDTGDESQEAILGMT